jgi:hypothetical protein
MPITFAAASAGAVLGSRPRRLCSSVLETVIAAVPNAPATSPCPIAAASPPPPPAPRMEQSIARVRSATGERVERQRVGR